MAKHARYIDFYGIDSEYDYDPFWAKVVELGRAGDDALRQPGLDRPAVDQQLHEQPHRPLRRWVGGLRQGAVLRRRDPALPGPARRPARGRRRLGRARLHAPGGPLGKAQPRGRCSNYDPARGRRRPARATLFRALRRRSCSGPHRSTRRERCSATAWASRRCRTAASRTSDELDDFALAGIESVEDIRARWVDNFFFGSEADDRTVAAAFNDKRQSARRQDQRDLVVGRGPLGRARPDRAAGREPGTWWSRA